MVEESNDIVKKNDQRLGQVGGSFGFYPGLKALAAHRISHFLWRHNCRPLARMHSQFWRFWTQIEIHPGAQIAEGVFVITVLALSLVKQLWLKKGAMLYHGVTLGGTGKDVGKRHPTVREGALVSAHAQIIGPIEIGKMPR